MLTAILNWYFNTFQICWNSILDALVVMITAYLDFLGLLVETLTGTPQVVVLSILAAVLMIIVAVIIKIIFPGWQIRRRERDHQQPEQQHQIAC